MGDPKLHNSATIGRQADLAQILDRLASENTYTYN